MLAAPDGLDEDALAAALLAGWGVRAASLRYRAVGWGSHHGDVLGGDGGRWFVTVDELESKRVSDAESLDDWFGRSWYTRSRTGRASAGASGAPRCWTE
jgi:spectinomycin phosphotransferase/16S rRNA (guanine(1405)-N(7))-methyltransferase